LLPDVGDRQKLPSAPITETDGVRAQLVPNENASIS
jgi:hypothetical protein